MTDMKYPIGIQNFASLRRDGYVYVDKTEIIYRMVNSGRYYFLSRPRRFGKSLLVSTLEAYFRGQQELFKSLAIEHLEKDWTVYPVLHLDLNTGIYNSQNALYEVLNDFLAKLETVYGTFPSETTLELRFKGIIQRIAEKEGQRVVILIDEYDKPLLQSFDDEKRQDDYRQTLKAFYGVMKSADEYIRFALLTGVTKFGKVSVFSDLNHLADISMDARYQTICGITEEEICKYFQAPLNDLATANGITADEAHKMVKAQYDGYHFRQNGINIYNPFSLLNCFATGEFGNYWFETGTPSFLVKVMQDDNFLLPEMTTEEVTSDLLNSIDTLKTSPIPLIYQSGYLTIKGYDKEFQTYILGFPNKEVEVGFMRYLLPYYTHVKKNEAVVFIGNFIHDLREGRPESFMQRMSVLFSDTDYKIVGDSELYFQNVFYIISKLLGFYTEVERTTSDGRMDMVIQTSNYIYILEFKYDSTPDVALRQIKEKGYAKPFAMDKRKIYYLGVNFSCKKRCIDGWEIEEK